MLELDKGWEALDMLDLLGTQGLDMDSELDTLDLGTLAPVSEALDMLELDMGSVLDSVVSIMGPIEQVTVPLTVNQIDHMFWKPQS
jgi:hypothetical protein